MARSRTVAVSSEYLPVAVRAFTEAPRDRRQGAAEKRAGRRRRSWRRPGLLLVFDTETATDVGQALLFGCVRVYRLDEHGPSLVEESLFHADDLAERDPAGYQRLVEYAQRRGIELRSRRAFVREVLWPVGYMGRGWIVGFNLPFDLSRLAVAWNPRRQAGSRGFSLALWDYQDKHTGEWKVSRFRPLISVETIDSKRALIRFGRVKKPRADYLIPEGDPYAEPDPNYTFPGHFLDLRTLAFALTGESHSLESACEDFHVKHPKWKAKRHGVITGRYVDYCRRDVLATAELAFALLDEYERHPISLRPTQVRSPASLAKGYLEAMGVTPFLERHQDFPRQLLGQAMVAYIGGRVETRLRRQLVPVVYLDFLSMYPTVNANMGLWRFFTCDQITIEDATEQVRELVGAISAEDLFQRDTWPQLSALCLVEPRGEVLPARAAYQRGGAWQIGVNPLCSRTPLWLTLPDVIGAKVIDGSAPRILEATRLTPIGLQHDLRPVKLLGEIEVDPARDDFFRVIVEQRARLERRSDLSKDERDWRRRLLKVIVNAASYGITAEMNPTALGAKTAPVTVYALGEAFEKQLHEVEQPGRYCFPPLAALITGAARLMLALLERSIADLGGTHVMADTDAMAPVATRDGGLIACNGGPHQLADGRPAVRALTYEQVGQIVARFAALSPYDLELIPSILKVEERYDDANGERLPLYAHSISAKRYALTTHDRSGEVIRKRSEHGLGHLLNPFDPDRDERDWITDAWDLLLHQSDVLGGGGPPWLDLPALTRIALTTKEVARAFKAYNAGRSWPEQIKPFNFLLHAHIDPLGYPAGIDPARFRLIAPYDRHADRWPQLPWVDLHSGRQHPVTTDPNDHRRGIVRLKTYRDVLARYASHPEPKSLDPDGNPCSRRSEPGLLARRPVTVSTISLIGKESNRLEETIAGLIGSLDDTLATYQSPTDNAWASLVLPALADFPSRELAELAGLNTRTLQRIKRRSIHTPHPANRALLTDTTARLAAERLETWGINPPRQPLEQIASYLDHRDHQQTPDVCVICGSQLTGDQRSYCSPRCAKRAYRARQAAKQDTQ